MIPRECWEWLTPMRESQTGKVNPGIVCRVLARVETGRGRVCRTSAFSAKQPCLLVLPTVILSLCFFFGYSPPGHCYHRNVVFTLWLAVHNNRVAYDVWLYCLWCTSGAFGTK